MPTEEHAKRIVRVIELAGLEPELENQGDMIVVYGKGDGVAFAVTERRKTYAVKAKTRYLVVPCDTILMRYSDPEEIPYMAVDMRQKDEKTAKRMIEYAQSLREWANKMNQRLKKDHEHNLAIQETEQTLKLKSMGLLVPSEHITGLMNGSRQDVTAKIHVRGRGNYVEMELLVSVEVAERIAEVLGK